jgi:serine/threonine-protein kinase
MAGDAIETVNAADYLGKTLDGRYRLDTVLGQGGMGLVFGGLQTSMQRPVAVKTLHPQLAMAPTFFERFKREAELASKLRHPNIITIYDFGRTTDGTCYFVMELLEGESLRQQVKREGPMALRRAVAIIEQAALGLSHAHKQHVVHRDVKPHNIMITKVDAHEYVKVLDFGLVKVMEQEDEEQLTSTGQVLGTPQYMPPEQAGGELVDQRSDLYSLAGVLFFMLTGSSPFGANTVRKALTAALTKTVPPIATIRQGAPVPKKVDEFMRKAMAREKEDRYQTVEEFLVDLNDALKGQSDDVLDALPTGSPGDLSKEGKEPGSGSEAGKKGSRGSKSGKASNVIVSTGILKPLPAVVTPSDRRETAPDMPMAAIPPPKETGTIKAVGGPPPEPSKLPMVAVGVAAALVLLAGGAWLVFGGKTAAVTPPPIAQKDPPVVAAPAPVEPTPTVAAALVTLHLTSKPAGATVTEDGAVIGRTPLDRKWPKDEKHALNVALDGFTPVDKTYRLGQDQDEEITLNPVKKAATGSPVKKKKDEGIQAFE